MLSQQARLLAFGPDSLHPERLVVTRDSAKDVRRIWPPPSPAEPSIVIIAFSIFSPLTMRRHFDQLGIELAENSHQVVLGGHHLVDILIDHRHFVQPGRN